MCFLITVLATHAGFVFFNNFPFLLAYPGVRSMETAASLLVVKALEILVRVIIDALINNKLSKS